MEGLQLVDRLICAKDRICHHCQAFGFVYVLGEWVLQAMHAVPALIMSDNGNNDFLCYPNSIVFGAGWTASS
jgi:hypothetical protein